MGKLHDTSCGRQKSAQRSRMIGIYDFANGKLFKREPKMMKKSEIEIIICPNKEKP